INLPDPQSFFRDGGIRSSLQDISGLNINAFQVKGKPASGQSMAGIGYSMERNLNPAFALNNIVPANSMNINFKRNIQLFSNNSLDLLFSKSFRNYVAESSVTISDKIGSGMSNFFTDSRIGLRYIGS